jgi:hypothetical protein
METQPGFEKLPGGSLLGDPFRYFGSKRWKFRPQWGQAISPKVGERVEGLLISNRKAFLQAGQRESG